MDQRNHHPHHIRVRRIIQPRGLYQLFGESFATYSTDSTVAPVVLTSPQTQTSRKSTVGQTMSPYDVIRVIVIDRPQMTRLGFGRGKNERFLALESCSTCSRVRRGLWLATSLRRLVTSVTYSTPYTPTSIECDSTERIFCDVLYTAAGME